MFLHLSVHGGGAVGFPACITGYMTSIRGRVCLQGVSASGDLHQGGSASRGSAFRGCLHLGVVWADPSPELGKWVVCIPLEYFLVSYGMSGPVWRHLTSNEHSATTINFFVTKSFAAMTKSSVATKTCLQWVLFFLHLFTLCKKDPVIIVSDSKAILISVYDSCY